MEELLICAIRTPQGATYKSKQLKLVRKEISAN
jgi:hypothetical protein